MTLLVDKYHETVDTLHFNEAESVLGNLRRDLRKAKERNDERLQAWTYVYSAMVMRGQRSYHYAVGLLGEARSLFEKNNDSVGAGYVYHEMAVANRELQRNALALEYADKAMKIFQDANMNAQLARVYDNMSVINFNLLRRQTSLIYAQKAHKLLSETGSALDRGWNATHLAHLYHEMGLLEKAAPHAQDSVKIFKKLKNNQGLAWGFYWLSMIARAQARFKEAMGHIVKAGKIFSSLHIKDREAWCLLTQAAIHRSLAELKQADAANKKAFQIFSPTRNSDGIAWSFFQIGRIERDRGHFIKAWKTFREVFNVHTDVSNQKGVAWAQCEWGLTYLALGDMSHALESFNKGLQIAEQVGEFFLKGEIHRNLADLHMSQALPESTADSLKHALDLGSTTKECEYRVELALLEAKHALASADVMAARGHVAAAEKIANQYTVNRLKADILLYQAELESYGGKEPKLHSYLERALQMCEKTGQDRLKVDILFGMVQLLCRRGQAAEAEKILAQADKIARNMSSRRHKALGILLHGMVRQATGRELDARYLMQSINVLEEAQLRLCEAEALEYLQVLFSRSGSKHELETLVARKNLFEKGAGANASLFPFYKQARLLPLSLVI